MFFQELQDRALTTEMMHQLCQEFLSPDPSDQVDKISSPQVSMECFKIFSPTQVHLFLLPSLASLHLLRLDPLVQCLLEEGE